MKTILCLSSFLLPLSVALGDGNDDFGDADFSLRLPAMLSHFNSYADVAAKGGASAAGKFGSSENPASIAWSFGQGYDTLVSAQYSNVLFDQGTRLHFNSGSATFGTEEAGVFRLDAGRITSNERLARNVPAAFEFDLGAVRLNYAKKFSEERLGIGASAGFGQSDTVFKTPYLDLVKAEKDIWTFRLGGLWQPQEKWLLGLASSYIYGPTETTFLTPTASGIVRKVVNDPTHQFTVQPGISYEYAPNALAHFDYQFGHFTNDTGSLTVNRWMAGTDIKLAQFFYLRAGGAIDEHGNTSWTAGIGFYPSRHFLIDLAYQDDVFPEVAREFGRSQTLNISLSVLW